MEGVHIWKFTSENGHDLMAYKKKKHLLEAENPTFMFALTQIQVVTFQCKHIFINDHKVTKCRLTTILKSVGIC
jgi:hypothetical protein